MMNKIINYIQELFLREGTMTALAHFSKELQDVLRWVAALEACYYDAVLRAQASRNEILVVPH